MEHENSVRVTNQRIYDLVLELRDDVRSVRQAQKDNVIPQLSRHRAQIESLKENKADRTETTKLEAAVASVRTQTYAVVGGVIAGLVALRTLGVI